MPDRGVQQQKKGGKSSFKSHVSRKAPGSRPASASPTKKQSKGGGKERASQAERGRAEERERFSDFTSNLFSRSSQVFFTVTWCHVCISFQSLGATSVTLFTVTWCHRCNSFHSYLVLQHLFSQRQSLDTHHSNMRQRERRLLVGLKESYGYEQPRSISPPQKQANKLPSVAKL